MQIHVLASGSKGNSMLVKMGETNILIDAGISARRIKNALTEVNTAVEDLDGVLITHEHHDHVSGLTTLIKKYRIPVYTRLDTWESMNCRKLLPADCCFNIKRTLDIGQVKVECFSILHDAADPVGFNLYHGDLKCSVATDLGFVTEEVKSAIAYSDMLVLEANHDLDMLSEGSYPWYLKQRIMSNRGHLSNDEAGWTLARIPKKDKMKVLLAHISKENNCPRLAEETVTSILVGAGCDLKAVSLQLTYPDRISSII